MSDKNRVRFFDTTLRDGEQAPGYSMTLEEKIRMAVQMETLGVDVMEAGFAIASPGDFESVKQIANTIKNATVASLSRALVKDIDAAAEAIKGAVNPRIHTFLATSDLHLEYKLKMSREDALERVKKMVAYARNLCAEVEFSAEDASRSDIDYLCKVVETAIASGASIINLPDTVGYSTPTELYNMIHQIHTRVPNMDKAILSVHCHDDLGLAVANSLAGVLAGARQVECTICGIGERAGNAALEELVMGLRTRHDFYGMEYGIKTEEIAKTARLLSSITGVKISPSKAIVGANAFAHESGIHQHGVMANAETYEIMTPESVGVKKTELVLGKHSGQHAFASRVASLGYTLTDERIAELFAEFKKLADRKKTISDRDLRALVEVSAPDTVEPDKQYRLESFVVNSGNNIHSTANVVLSRGKKTYEEVALGTGPVFACIRAVEKIIRHPFSLDDYQIQAVTEHRDALGEVHVKISDETGTYRGRGVSTDIIEGSILACLSAVNKMLDEHQSGMGTSCASCVQKTFENDMLAGGHTDK
jgi:2-isopropylmalate synthase